MCTVPNALDEYYVKVRQDCQDMQGKIFAWEATKKQIKWNDEFCP